MRPLTSYFDQAAGLTPQLPGTGKAYETKPKIKNKLLEAAMNRQDRKIN